MPKTEPANSGGGIMRAADKAIRDLPRENAPQNHAAIDITEGKTITVEGGGTIKDTLSWSAYFKKVWRGPWSAGSTWRW